MQLKDKDEIIKELDIQNKELKNENIGLKLKLQTCQGEMANYEN